MGLGNPGKKYEGTRHNAGFMVIDKLSEKYNIDVNKLKFKSLIGTGTIEGKKVLLIKPDTFMNLSGQAVTEAMNFYKIKSENVIVIFDDISLDVGKIRIRRKGSHGGQNGMKNIIYLSGTDTFPRVKVGIGEKPHKDYDLANWVLSKFSNDDMKLMDKSTDNACGAVRFLVMGETDKAMSEYNS